MQAIPFLPPPSNSGFLNPLKSHSWMLEDLHDLGNVQQLTWEGEILRYQGSPVHGPVQAPSTWCTEMLHSPCSLPHRLFPPLPLPPPHTPELVEIGQHTLLPCRDWSSIGRGYCNSLWCPLPLSGCHMYALWHVCDTLGWHKWLTLTQMTFWIVLRESCRTITVFAGL